MWQVHGRPQPICRKHQKIGKITRNSISRGWFHYIFLNFFMLAYSHVLTTWEKRLKSYRFNLEQILAKFWTWSEMWVFSYIITMKHDMMGIFDPLHRPNHSACSKPKITVLAQKFVKWWSKWQVGQFCKSGLIGIKFFSCQIMNISNHMVYTNFRY